MYELWYDYLKQKYGDNVKLCYIDTDSFIDNVKLCYMDSDSFIVHFKTEDFYKDAADDIEKRFDTSNNEVNRPLPAGKGLD